jgi:hypothetical protein
MFHPPAGRDARLVAGGTATAMSYFAIGGSVGFFLAPAIATPALDGLGVAATALFIPPHRRSRGPFLLLAELAPLDDLDGLGGVREGQPGGHGGDLESAALSPGVPALAGIIGAGTWRQTATVSASRSTSFHLSAHLFGPEPCRYQQHNVGVQAGGPCGFAGAVGIAPGSGSWRAGLTFL